MRIVVVVLGILAGFNVLSSIVGSGLLLILTKVVSDPDLTAAGLAAIVSGIIAGLIGALACPLLVHKILRDMKRKAHIITMCILAAIAALPLPAPSFYVLF